MIFANSRYASSKTTLVTDPLNGQSRLVIVPSSAKPYSFQFLFHIVTGTENDRPDLLANNYYGDSQLWWVIADANPEVMNWSSLATGTLIRIPSVS